MKDAVVFIIDASPSMNTQYPRDNFKETSKVQVKTEDGAGIESTLSSSSLSPSTRHPNTRLGCAKKLVQSMIADLMVASITNEVCVILLKTLKTHHHKIAAGMDLEEEDFDSIPFPNLTELTNGVTRPSMDLLQWDHSSGGCTLRAHPQEEISTKDCSSHGRGA
jgi:hypothetical protein